MSAKPPTLTHCPVCRYSLTGLPRNHRCPECGFEYDQTTVVWRPPVFPRWFLFMIWMFLFALASTSLDPRPLFRRLGFSGSEASAIVFFLSAVPSFIGLYYPRGMIVVTARGIGFRGPFGSVDFVPWREIRLERDRPVLYAVKGRAKVELPLSASGLTRRRRRLLHTIIVERWRVAGGADGEPSGVDAAVPDA